MKIQFEVIEIDHLPDNWIDVKSWPKKGLYRVMTHLDRDNLYLVSERFVECAFDFVPVGLFVEEEDFIPDLACEQLTSAILDDIRVRAFHKE